MILKRIILNRAILKSYPILMVKTANEKIYLKPGSLLLIPQGILHAKMMSKSKWVSVGFSYNKVKNVKSHNFFEKIDRMCNCSSPRIITSNPGIIAELHGMFFKQDTFGNTVFDILHLLDILLRINAELNTESDCSDSAHKKKDQDVFRLSHVEHILANYFMENICDFDAAQMLHISERQLNRIMQKNFGMSFKEKISEYRINMACLLLKDTDFSAEEIGKMVGYNNKSTFYVAFRKKLGMTPAEYRMLIK